VDSPLSRQHRRVSFSSPPERGSPFSGANRMHLDVQDGITIIHLDSNYSAFNEPHLDELQDRLLKTIAETPLPHIILHFGETEYFSSVFFEVLFRAWKRTREKQGRFALCSLQPGCMEILETAKLDTLWDIYPDLDAAIHSSEVVGT
jgi:anti-anti-sigma factor